MASVSVIIPAYNATRTIGQALAALAHQDYPQHVEVIVVDDGSTDQTSQIVKTYPNVIYIYQKNAGPAAARNKGASIAKGDVLCFTDSDCVPHPDWISLLIKGFSVDSTGAVCGSYGIANPESVLARGIQAEIAFRHQYLLPDYPLVFGSYNVAIRKRAFDAVGGFDESFREASGEDNNLSYKLQSAGYRIFFARKALVNHHHTTIVWKYLREQFRHGYWRVKMYLNHPGMIKGDNYTYWKDMLEVPWGACCILSLVVSALHVMRFGDALKFIILPFCIFEMINAFMMLRNIFESIFFGIVMFLRAFARMSGLSTGIFNIFFKKNKKKSK